LEYRQMSLFRSLSLAVPAAIVCIMPAAHADEYVDRANTLYAQIRTEHRSDLILFPAVAKMDQPPASVAQIQRAILLPAGTSGWAEAEAWANAEPQRAVLQALQRAAANTQMAVGQPYGALAMGATSEGIELIDYGMYTELGETGLLAGARFLYLPKLDTVGSLVNVEATRLAAEGKPADAIRTLADWLFFCRQMADREMFPESRWGLRSMIAACERIRDIAYQDFRSGNQSFSVDQILAVLERLRTDDGYLMGDRLIFPQANRIAAEQVIAHTFIQRGGVNTARFGQTMARIASTDRPLRLFAEAAKWEQVGVGHADYFETSDQLGRVYNDWTNRWRLDPWDRINRGKIPDYETTSPNRFAVIRTVIPDMSVLFHDRQVLRTQIVGTRTSLGVMAFTYRNRMMPSTLAGIRPTFVREIEADPFNFERDTGRRPPLEYFVPIRDQRFGEREQPRPHEMNVILGGDVQNFRVSIGQDQFILYSVGPDHAKNWARDVSGEPAPDGVGDLLLWPPVSSLLRQRLVEAGQFR
jgi:hypothetical protein